MFIGFLTMPTKPSSDLSDFAREDELRLAGHRVLIDDAAVDHVLVGIGAK